MTESIKIGQQRFVQKLKEAKLEQSDILFDVGISHDHEFKFELRNSGIFFKTYSAKGSFERYRFEYSTCSPDRTIERVLKDTSLDEVLKQFEYWIKDHVLKFKRDAAIPDPWTQLTGEFDHPINNEKFTSQESLQMEQSLERFPGFLIERIEIAPDKLDSILEEIQELKKDLKIKTKKRWLKELILFMVEEVWEAVRNDAIMHQVKAYFFNTINRVTQDVPPIFKHLR